MKPKYDKSLSSFAFKFNLCRCIEADDNTTALFNLGLSYLKGTGVKESCLPTALSFWQRAADLGHAGAQVNIGEAYRDGAGGRG